MTTTRSMTEVDKAPLILVIDDEETQRLMTRDHLESAGFRVEEAVDGVAGFAMARDLRPDLILLDVIMPGLDGLEVCRLIRMEESLLHTPVVIVTGNEGTDEISAGFAAGATDFLVKPVIWNLLPFRVRYVMRTSALENDLRIARDQAEGANRAKSRLLSIMAHELRTPLNSIIGFSELMQNAAYGPLGNDQYSSFAGDINAAGNNLLTAVNAMLEIVSCETVDPSQERDPVDVEGMLDGIRSQFEADALSGGVTVHIDVAGDIPPYPVYGSRLRKAIVALVSNAVRFTPPGGEVFLTAVSEEDGALRLAVRDTGSGIRPEDLARVQQPFEQGDGALSRAYEGLGLGLPLASAIASLHGGQLDLESAPDAGTTATILLPVPEEEGGMADIDPILPDAVHSR